ncbi:MAG: hypothetical protein QNJ15_14465 [Erythrobacter sp.]|nr:hypothetical protein [Erythrobacter sp.]
MRFRPKGRSPRRPFHPKRFDHGQPIHRIETSPVAIALGMVLLAVLLNVQIHSHATVFELSENAFEDLFGQSVETPHLQLNTVATQDSDALINRLVISENDVLLWNDQVITEHMLVKLIREVRRSVPGAVLQIEPDPLAGYEQTARVLEIIRIAEAPRVELVGLEAHCRTPDEVNSARPSASYFARQSSIPAWQTICPELAPIE